MPVFLSVTLTRRLQSKATGLGFFFQRPVRRPIPINQASTPMEEFHDPRNP